MVSWLNKNILKLFLVLFIFIISLLLFNNCWKITFSADVADNMQDVCSIEYVRFGKIKQKQCKITNNHFSVKLTLNTNSIFVKNSDLLNLKNIKLDSYKLNSLNDFEHAKIHLLKIYNIVFVAASFLLSFCFCFLFFYYKKTLFLVKEIIKNIEKINLNAFLFYLSLAFSFALFIKFIHCPILEYHGFRQTQTAISSYYLINNLSLDSILNYETPVLGYPYSIPFEFPIYQVICALLTQIVKLDLSVAGRLVSYVFTIASLYPIYLISKKIKDDINLFYIIGILFVCSPLYIFWGKTFMIETITLFFGLMFLANFIEYLCSGKNINLFNLFLFSLLCGLSKITTLFGFCIVAGIYFLYQCFKNRINVKQIVSVVLGMLVSLIISYLWVHYSDVVKLLNPIAYPLTSKNLAFWNYGTLQQRFSLDFYKVIFTRMLPDILGSFVIFILAVIASFKTSKANFKIAYLCLGAFFGVLIVFTNLHYVHNYYQTSIGIFLILFVGLIFYDVFSKRKILYFGLIFLTLCFMVYRNMSSLVFYEYALSNPILKVGEFIDKNIENGELLVVGLDWSSEIHYYSKRKGIALPRWKEFALSDVLKTDNNDIYKCIVVVPGITVQEQKLVTDILEYKKPKKMQVVDNFKIYYDFYN